MDEDLPLRRRVPGAAGREAPASARPVLAESVLLRMQAAIDAAKTDLEEQDRDPITEPIPAISASRAKGAKGAKAPGPAAPGADARTDQTAKPARKPKRNPAASPGHTPMPDRLSAFSRRKRDAVAQGGSETESATRPQAPAAPPASANGSAAPSPGGSVPRSPSGSVPPWSAAEPGLPALPKRDAPARPEAKPDPATLPKRDVQPRAEAKPELPKRDVQPRAEATPDQAALPKRDAPAQPGHTALPSRAAAVQPAAPARPTLEPERQDRPERTAPSARPTDDREPAVDRQPASGSVTRTPPDGPARPEPSALRQRSAPAGGTTAPPGRGTPHQGRRQTSRGRRSTPRLVATAVVIVAAAATAAFALSAQSPPSRSHQLTPLQRAENRNQALAVAWVGAQVSPGTVVSCDPKTCSALVAHRHPAANVRRLNSTSLYPKDSSVVVETAEVRAIFGTSLAAAWAPNILDTIGSGAAQVTIRVIAPRGSTAYQQALAADLVNRKHNGAALADLNRITTAATARSQLDAGQVDSRLLLAMVQMANANPIDVVDFGNLATGASADLPLRYADLAEHVPAAHQTDAAYVRSMLSALRSLPAQFKPLWTERLPLPDGQVLLRVMYSAPSPLNLLGPTGP